MAYKPNYLGTRAMLNGPEMVAMLENFVQGAKVRAEAIAPVETGRYKEHFEAGVDHKKKDRPRGFLRNTMFYAMSVEFGAGPVPRHRTLGKAFSPELYH